MPAEFLQLEAGRYRVLMVAPFARGLDHGGSQRATAMAERLEERGCRVTWLTVTPRARPPIAKALAGIQGRPALVELYPAQRLTDVTEFDVVIAVHSYLAHYLNPLPPQIVRVVDFHNLEWRHLADILEFERGPRRAYARAQIGLMRRFERRAIARSSVSTFVSETELRWGQQTEPGAKSILVPSVLPRRNAAEALAQAERPTMPDTRELAYVGTLTFPPNLYALRDFLAEIWPTIRKAVPRARLTVAGAVAPAEIDHMRRVPGVQALGFVPELAPVLDKAAAVLMPIRGGAGTSLRALGMALARTWVIGSPAAFRGLPWRMGATAHTPEEWAQEVLRALEPDAEREKRTAQAHRDALAVQSDPAPWDNLFTAIDGLSDRA